MYTLSAFADEISPDPEQQIAVLKNCGVRHIELRSIHQTNVLDLTDLQVREFKALLDGNGFRLSAIGSPIGKIRIDRPLEAQQMWLERLIDADLAEHAPVQLLPARRQHLGQCRPGLEEGRPRAHGGED